LLLPPPSLDCVVSIGTASEKEERIWIASGFLYGSPTPTKTENGKTLYNTFLVSNRHVFQGLKKAFVRVNPKEAKPPTDYPLELLDEYGKPRWFPHPSENVDIAVIPVNIGLLREQGMQIQFAPADIARANRFRSDSNCEGGSPGEIFGHSVMPFELPSEGPKPSMLLRVVLSATPPGYRLN
jgi:hypothetical protein